MGLPKNFPGSDGMGLLLVACWCGVSFCWVAPEDVRQGRTGVCGRAECRALGQETAA